MGLNAQSIPVVPRCEELITSIIKENFSGHQVGSQSERGWEKEGERNHEPSVNQF